MKYKNTPINGNASDFATSHALGKQEALSSIHEKVVLERHKQRWGIKKFEFENLTVKEETFSDEEAKPKQSLFDHEKAYEEKQLRKFLPNQNGLELLPPGQRQEFSLASLVRGVKMAVSVTL